MKSQTALIALIIAAFVLIVIQGCSSETEADHLRPKSNLEQSIQQVRVVLLRIGPNKSTKGEPEFVVTFGIEVSKKGAFSDLVIDSNEVVLTVGGKPVVFHGGTEEASTGFEGLPRRSELNKPVVGEGNAMLFEDIIFKTLQIDAKQVDLKIQFSWRKIPMRFDFKDVPIGYRYRTIDSSRSRQALQGIEKIGSLPRIEMTIRGIGKSLAHLGITKPTKMNKPILFALEKPVANQ